MANEPEVYVPQDTTHRGKFFAKGWRVVPLELAEHLEQKYGENAKPKSEVEDLQTRVLDLTAQLEGKTAQLETLCQAAKVADFEALKALLEQAGNPPPPPGGWVVTNDNPNPPGSAAWFKHELEANAVQFRGNASTADLQALYDQSKGGN